MADDKREEWRRLLDELREATLLGLADEVGIVDAIRVAVERALDEREAASLKSIADTVEETVVLIRHCAAAVEKRAGRAGGS